jgi:TatA/E family protein of Tat protein translocase
VCELVVKGGKFRCRWECRATLVIVAILLLVFGAKRVPHLARSLGTGARELKKAASDDADDSDTKEAGLEDTPSEWDGDRVEREPRTQ